MNPIGPTPEQRAAALKHIDGLSNVRRLALGAKVVGGPLHSTLGHFSGEAPTEDERRRAVDFHRAAGEIAGKHGVTIALEAINRFECYFVNTMSDLAAYVGAVAHPNVSAMYDTFHANIEEKVQSPRSPQFGPTSRTCISRRTTAARRAAGISTLPPYSRRSSTPATMAG